MDNAEEGVRRAIARIAPIMAKAGGDGVFEYRMDGGAPLRVAVTLDAEARTATVRVTVLAALEQD